ncbi:hypothetical protein HC752_08600 [Vibrio sp. S9_S30]|uniref:hypothetical protein n=1 Tax=Vibrio sp. S9_S30 TaxID=2720226 RepID=UPI001681AC8F|nr:hypothetical protein [Vibrio sp. S9_S30]MBD1556995.1 hypothetical protein [Vibrio sp. S9_S30]
MNRYQDEAYWQIRGREQQNIDYFGGAINDRDSPGKSGNRIRGVAKDNPNGRAFHENNGDTHFKK